MSSGPLTELETLTVTVLIPAHNEESTIEQCVRAVQASTYPIERTVVVTWAGPKADRTAEIARSLGAEVVETEIQSKDGKQNLVLDSITSDVVVGFDGDTFPEPDCIELMIQRIQSGFDAVGATVLPVQPKGFFIRARRFAYALGRRHWRWAQSAVGRVQVLTGACYAFKTEAIKSVGGFPSVGISADMDATWALHGAGYNLSYVGKAVALTVDPDNLGDYRKQMRRWAAGYFQTMAKHRRQLTHWRAILVVWTAMLDMLTLPISYGLLAWGLIHQQPWVKGYFWFMLGRTVVNIFLVTTVVGLREALLGVVPYTLVNFYNKTLYLWTFFREWILGRHYSAWTGRHGFGTEITPMSYSRKMTLSTISAIGLLFLSFYGVSKNAPEAFVASATPYTTVTSTPVFVEESSPTEEDPPETSGKVTETTPTTLNEEFSEVPVDTRGQDPVFSFSSPPSTRTTSRSINASPATTQRIPVRQSTSTTRTVTSTTRAVSTTVPETTARQTTTTATTVLPTTTTEEKNGNPGGGPPTSRKRP